jgi:hypothetical protein
MLTKEYINELKIKGNGALSKAISEFKDKGSLTFFLEKLGHLPKECLLLRKKLVKIDFKGKFRKIHLVK